MATSITFEEHALVRNDMETLKCERAELMIEQLHTTGKISLHESELQSRDAEIARITTVTAELTEQATILNTRIQELMLELEAQQQGREKKEAMMQQQLEKQRQSMVLLETQHEELAAEWEMERATGRIEMQKSQKKNREKNTAADLAASVRESNQWDEHQAELARIKTRVAEEKRVAEERATARTQEYSLELTRLQAELTQVQQKYAGTLEARGQGTPAPTASQRRGTPTPANMLSRSLRPNGTPRSARATPKSPGQILHIKGMWVISSTPIGCVVVGIVAGVDMNGIHVIANVRSTDTTDITLNELLIQVQEENKEGTLPWLVNAANVVTMLAEGLVMFGEGDAPERSEEEWQQWIDEVTIAVTGVTDELEQVEWQTLTEEGEDSFENTDAATHTLQTGTSVQTDIDGQIYVGAIKYKALGFVVVRFPTDIPYIHQPIPDTRTHLLVLNHEVSRASPAAAPTPTPTLTPKPNTANDITNGVDAGIVRSTSLTAVSSHDSKMWRQFTALRGKHKWIVQASWKANDWRGNSVVSGIMRDIYDQMLAGPHANLTIKPGDATTEKFAAYSMFDLLHGNPYARLISMSFINIDKGGKGYGIKEDITKFDVLGGWINRLFSALTGTDYANYGNELMRNVWQTIRDEWDMGAAETGVDSWLTTVDLDIISQQFADMEGKITQLCKATSFGPLITEQMIEVAKKSHAKHVRDEDDGPRLFWAEIRKTLIHIMEGADGLSGVRGFWKEGERTKARPLGCIYEFSRLDNPPQWATIVSPQMQPPAQSPTHPPTHHRRASQDSPRVLAMRQGEMHDNTTSTDYEPSMNAIRYENRQDKKTPPVHVPIEEAMRYKDAACWFHTDRMLEASVAKGAKDPTYTPMTRQMCEQYCHPNKYCVSEFNKYCNCTVLKGGGDAIRSRAAMASSPEKTVVYEDHLAQVQAYSKALPGPRITTLMEVHFNTLGEVEVGTESQ